MSPIFRKALLAAVVVALPSPLLAQEDYVGGTFIYYTLEKNESEIEVWLDRLSDSKDSILTSQFEHGFTDHFMVDATLRYLHDNGSTVLEEGLVELRLRLGEAGTHLVDTAVSLEVAREDDENFLEPQLILSKDFGGWNATTNLTAAFNVDEGDGPTFAWAVGLRTPALGRWKLGLEVQRPVTEDERFIRLMPQVRYNFGKAGSVAVGTGITVSGDAEEAEEAEDFIRLAVEIEL